MGQRILVAFDDSEDAMRAVNYVAEALKPDSKVTLFSVIPDTASVCEMQSPELTPYFLSQRDAFCTIEDKKQAIVESSAQEAKKRLIKAGFKEDRIGIKIKKRAKGVARDIAAEASAGYDTLILGKRGLSGIKEFFLGSVSQKALQSAKDVTVILVN